MIIPDIIVFHESSTIYMFPNFWSRKKFIVLANTTWTEKFTPIALRDRLAICKCHELINPCYELLWEISRHFIDPLVYPFSKIGIVVISRHCNTSNNLFFFCFSTIFFVVKLSFYDFWAEMWKIFFRLYSKISDLLATKYQLLAKISYTNHKT